MLYLTKTPFWLRWLSPSSLWRLPAREKTLYLTFDDGPIPEVTPWVLDTLRAAHAQATFFCVGDNVRKYPEVFGRLQREGHSVGNHTFHHLDGWRTDTPVYLDNVALCAEKVTSNLFRPPYGRLKPAQGAALRQKGFQIVLWDVLAGDFDPKASPEVCFRNVTRHARPGSIVVLHDSLKAQPRLVPLLPRLLEHFGGRGYRFEAIRDLPSASQTEFF